MENIYNKKVEIQIPKGSKFVHLMDILYIVSDKPYIKIAFINGTYFLIKDSLTRFCQKLPFFFFRCNKSEVVNLSYVIEHKFIDSILQVRLQPNMEFTISRRKQLDFFTNLNKTPLYAFCQQCSSCHLRDICLNKYR